IDIAVGDLDDAESLTAATRGVDGVFYMQLAPLPTQAGYIVQAAKAAGVSKIVLLSSLGTVLQPLPMIGARIAARDEVFRQSGLDVTYLRANGLMSNALGWVPPIRDEGRVLDATDPGRLGGVDPYDVARIGVLPLTQDGHAGHGYILNGPQALTAREQVETLAEVLGRPIEFVPVTPEEFARHSVEHGTPAEMAGAVQNLNELFRAGRAGVHAAGRVAAARTASRNVFPGPELSPETTSIPRSSCVRTGLRSSRRRPAVLAGERLRDLGSRQVNLGTRGPLPPR